MLQLATSCSCSFGLEEIFFKDSLSGFLCVNEDPQSDPMGGLAGIVQAERR